MNPVQNIGIVYASTHHENTRKLAEVFAAELSGDLMTVDQAKAMPLENYQLIGLGSGIYFGRHDSHLRQLVDSWSSAQRYVFIFSTAGLPFLRWFQHAALRRRLRRKGCVIVGEFCCRGWDTVGPLWLMGGINRRHPNEKDLARARRFAHQLKNSLANDCGTGKKSGEIDKH